MIVEGIRRRLAQRLQELGEGAKSEAIKARLRQHQLNETFAAMLLKGRRGAPPPDPGISKLEQLAKALNVSRSWLILGIGKSDPIFDQVKEESPSAERPTVRPSGGNIPRKK
jgi:transcriptional regulator with XRE-family HTH domain